MVDGYAVGIITNTYLGYDGFQAGVAVFDTNDILFDCFVETNLFEGEHQKGYALGKQLMAKKYAEKPNILLMYDSINRGSGKYGIR